MTGRTIAIGDIHGCSDALAALIETVAPAATDTIVLLGDSIDRGPDSRGVIEQLINLRKQCGLVTIMGDHEEMLLDALEDETSLEKWLRCGDTETLRSYGWTDNGTRTKLTELIPRSHLDFLSGSQTYCETASHFFVHGGFVPELALSEQPVLALRWRVTAATTVMPHCSGKVAVVGHTPQRSGEVLDLGFLICIDTNCVRGGWLTALEVGGEIWQANREGKIRSARHT